MRRRAAYDATGMEEITVTVVGSVDSGKSSTVGTLVTGQLDDGNGLSRSCVFVHPHERETGRTSDISYQYAVDEEAKRILTFVDLAGHEMYLKTTLNGLVSSNPDFAIVCISDKITSMTKEHIGVCISMGIPICVLMTKSDMVPVELSKMLFNEIKLYFKRAGKTTFQIKTANDLTKIPNLQVITPIIYTSNKTGEGLDILRQLLRKVNKRETLFPSGLLVEHIYNVQGHGMVVSGYTGEDISKGDTLYLGPVDHNKFIEVTVRSIHNDYRFEIDTLQKGKKGCLAIGIGIKKNRNSVVRKGMILSHNPPKNICKEFTALVKVFHHGTTIKPGYQSFLNCGTIREPIEVLEICDEKKEKIEYVRSGDKVLIHVKFIKNTNYMEPGQRLIFREGTTRGIGTVQSIAVI